VIEKVIEYAGKRLNRREAKQEKGGDRN